jgi:hypothetical protein
LGFKLLYDIAPPYEPAVLLENKVFEILNRHDLLVYPDEQSSCIAPPDCDALFCTNYVELSIIRILSKVLMAPPFEALQLENIDELMKIILYKIYVPYILIAPPSDY